MSANPNDPAPKEAPSVSQDEGGSAWQWVVSLIVLAAVGGGGTWVWQHYFHGGAKEATKGNASYPPVPVVAAKVKKGDMDIYLQGLGTVTALNTVSVHSRVDGELARIAYKEGEMVHEGDLLVEIDKRPFEVALQQAEGQLAKDEATLENARIELARDEKAKDAIPAQQVDTQKALVHQYEGTIASDKAQVETAKLQLGYCTISSPLTGRVSLRPMDAGNLVRANDPTPLAVITQVQPISVVFYLPQDNVKQVVDLLAKPNAEKKPVVEVYGRDLKTRLATGELAAVDNQIDTSTGTIKCKALFKNDDGALFPNQFINARLRVETRKDALLVPTAAIQRGADGLFVYAVATADDDKVDMRKVVPGPTEGDLTLVAGGVADGDVVVIQGVDKLRPGAKVTATLEGGEKGKPSKAPSEKKGQ